MDFDNEQDDDEALEKLEKGMAGSFVERPQWSDKPVRYMAVFAVVIIFWGSIYSYVPKTILLQMLWGFGGFIICMALIAALVHAFRRFSEQYSYTEDELEIKSGRLLRQSRSISWSDVRVIDTKVSLMQRYFGTGDLTLSVSDNPANMPKRVVLIDVSQPERKKKLLHQLIASYNQRQNYMSSTKVEQQEMTKIKVLLLSANPDGVSVLKLDEEMRLITQKIRASKHRDLIEIVIAGEVRPDDLLQALNEHQPHVVQFSGHGSANDEILVCDENGRAKPISKEALVALFKSVRGKVHLVVLNSCYSRRQAEAIVTVVPCAIGMKDTIDDRSAAIFAASFYRAVGFGESVENAFEQGIAAIKLNGVTRQSDVPELLTMSGKDASEIIFVKS